MVVGTGGDLLVMVWRWQDGAVSPISGEFLEKKGLLRAALAKEAELARQVPGYGSREGDADDPPLLDPRIRGLVKLTEVGRWTGIGQAGCRFHGL